MAFNPLNKVTKGLLVAATIAIATQGYLAPSVGVGAQAGFKTPIPIFSAGAITDQIIGGSRSLLGFWAGGISANTEVIPLPPKKQQTSSSGGASAYPSPYIKVTKSKKNLYDKYKEKHIKQLMQDDEELIAIITAAINAGII